MIVSFFLMFGTSQIGSYNYLLYCEFLEAYFQVYSIFFYYICSCCKRSKEYEIIDHEIISNDVFLGSISGRGACYYLLC